MAPFAPGLFYQIWEIPIVIAFLIISPIAGIVISLLNTVVLFAVFPGALPTGPIYNLAATLSMQLGLFLTVVIAKRFSKNSSEGLKSQFKLKWIVAATGMGMMTRVVLMSVILFVALPQPPPFGYAFNTASTIAFLPLGAVFNATLALYTIPIAYVVAGRVVKVLKLTMPDQNYSKKQ
jgi:riboflavin transporter FmnP